MPNHITNWVEIKGTEAQITKLVIETLKEKENREAEFDFNGITPMPQELKETVSPPDIVDTQAEADKINADFATQPYPIGSDQKIKAITLEERNRRLVKYGVTNWYDWANENWGTKWGAYEVFIEAQTGTSLVLQFNTAWSPPTPIFEKLVREGYEVNCFWQDEDPSNSGTFGDPYEAFDIDLSATVEYLGGGQ